MPHEISKIRFYFILQHVHKKRQRDLVELIYREIYSLP